MAKIHNNELKILSVNCNGLWKNTALIGDLAKRKHVQIIAVQETNARPRYRYKIPGFQFYRRDPDRTIVPATRGVGLYVRQDIKHSRLPDPQFLQAEHLTVKFQAGSKNFFITSLYNSPSRHQAPLEDIDNLLRTSRSEPHIIIGDLNCRHHYWDISGVTNEAGRELADHAESSDYDIAAPPSATRDQGQRPSTLDIALINNLAALWDIEALPELDSDHKPVLLTIKLKLDLIKRPKRYALGLANWENLRQQLSEQVVRMPSRITPDSLEGMAKSISENIKRAADNCIPKRRPRASPMELPDGILQLKAEKNRARRTAQRTKDPNDTAVANRLAQILRDRIREYRQQRWESALNEAEASPNHTAVWRIGRVLKSPVTPIPTLIDGAQTFDTDIKKTEALASHYEGVHVMNNDLGNPQHDETQRQITNDYLSEHRQEENITETTLIELASIIKNLKNKKSPGPDAIPNEVFKQIPEETVSNLRQLFNACMKIGHFPQVWKTAKIVPLPKPGKDHTSPKNYRPISLLNNIGKIFEKIICNRISNYLEENSLLNEQQFGFRRSHSTTHQIVRITDHIARTLNFNEIAVAGLLDCTEAFPTVNKNLLLSKMCALNIPRYLVRTIDSYLSNRNFYVEINGVTSRLHPIGNGTPQGSILGPLLFIIYVNDIPTPPRCILSLYADDTAIVSRSLRASTARDYLENGLGDIARYMDLNKIRINPTKTELVLFTRKRVTPLQNMDFEGESIEFKTKAKLLGVTIDSKLNFKSHIDNVIRKTNGAMQALSPILQGRTLSEKLKCRLYKAYIRPIISYGCPAWYTRISNTNLLRLQRIQNKCLRRALSVRIREISTNELHERASCSRIGTFLRTITENFAKKTRDCALPHISSLYYTAENLPFTPTTPMSFVGKRSLSEDDDG